MGARFSTRVQTCPEAHPDSYTMGTGSFPVVKQPGRGLNHPPPSSVEVEGRVELHIFSPSRVFVACPRENFLEAEMTAEPQRGRKDWDGSPVRHMTQCLLLERSYPCRPNHTISPSVGACETTAQPISVRILGATLMLVNFSSRF